MTDAPQSAGLVALAERIELWPIDRLRPRGVLQILAIAQAALRSARG